MRPDALANALALLERLVAFPTQSERSNLAMAAFVEDYLRGLGVEVLRAPNAAGDKVALLATIGPMVDGGIALSGHMDVVPVEGQAWSGDPFALRRQGERLYGRGACDMKGFDAAVLAMVPAFLAAPLRRPAHILLSYDEETTCRGSLDLIARFGAGLPVPGAALVGEPTMMQVADAHKSVATFETRVTGLEAHSANPALGANAVAAACDIAAEIARLARRYEAGPALNPRFDPPCSTLNVGLIRGGEARNILARDCFFLWEFRGLPGVESAEPLALVQRYVDAVALPRLKGRHASPSIATRMEVDVPGLAAASGSLAESLALRLTRSNRTCAVSYATEAGHFQRAGIPTIVCGPGSIEQAHRPDEYIDVGQLAACVDFLGRLADELCA